MTNVIYVDGHTAMVWLAGLPPDDGEQRGHVVLSLERCDDVGNGVKLSAKLTGREAVELARTLLEQVDEGDLLPHEDTRAEAKT